MHFSICKTYFVYCFSIDLCWIGGGRWGQSVIGICAFFYMSNLFGVVVFERSIFEWRRGWSLSVIGICAFFYMSNLFGIVILQRSMLDWRRGEVSLQWAYVNSAICETYLV